MNETKKALEEAGLDNYLGYGESVSWLNYQGLPIPSWANLSGAIQSAWMAGAAKVIRAFCDNNNLVWCSSCKMYRTSVQHRCPVCDRSISV